MIYSAVLVRYTGEFGVKSAQSQTYIEDLIHNNLRRALINAGGQVFIVRFEFVFRQVRLYLNIDKALDTDINLLVSVAGRLFGISSISPCFRTPVRDSTAVVSVAAKLKCLPTALADIQMLGENHFEIDDSGRIITKEGITAGLTVGVEPDVWLEEMKNTRPHWWEMSSGSGATGGTGGSNGTNPFAKASWNKTEQSKLPSEKADQYAKSAGFVDGAAGQRAQAPIEK